MSHQPSDVLQRLERPAWIVGGIGILASILGAIIATDQFFRSYLLAYLFWFAIAAGSLPLVMIHHLVGGRWGFVIRRILESSARMLPLMALLFVPLLFGIHHLYEWSHADVVAKDSILKHKSLYLNTPFFIGRAALYFVLWVGLGWLLNRWSSEQDRASSPALARRFQRLSGPGLIVYALTVTFASTDWVMSLEPHWFSTIYGMLFMVGQVTATLAFAIAVLAAMSGTPPLSGFVEPQTLQDLGNLLFAFIMLWAYLSFSQYLIIWSANLPEEIPWYLRRSTGGWQWVAGVLAVFHFAVPFLLLLMRRNKRRLQMMAAIAIAIVAMRAVDLLWLVAPAHEAALHVHWLDAVTLLGIGGLFMALFSRQLRKKSLVPLGDPDFPVRGTVLSSEL
jgi:hypothetical protein